jgi:hypothetical protein
MNIGKPKREIEVEPVSVPVPEVLPDPVAEPAPVAEPGAPVSDPSTAGG